MDATTARDVLRDLSLAAQTIEGPRDDVAIDTIALFLALVVSAGPDAPRLARAVRHALHVARDQITALALADLDPEVAPWISDYTTWGAPPASGGPTS